MQNLDHLYFEDSYFLGLTVSGKRLRLRVLFALAVDHPCYVAPHPGEQHCYREGDIIVDEMQKLAFSERRPSLLLEDPDGTFDLGSIEFSQQGDIYLVTTDWFELQFRAEAVTVTLE